MTAIRSALRTFVEDNMRMSAVYQPMIIKAMLSSEDGKAPMEKIATDISELIEGDNSKSKYYLTKLRLHPVKVLTKHGIATVKKGSDTFTMKDSMNFDDTTEKQVIIDTCNRKIREYLNNKLS